MNFELRPITTDEFVAFMRTEGTAFGHVHSDEDIERYRQEFEVDRSLAVFDRQRLVATANANSYALTLPGGVAMAVSGICDVGVLPTYRRRGLLRMLMRRQLDDVRARGEALAILHATEGSIYGRFGYGLAASELAVTLDSRRAAFRLAPETAGRVTLLDPAEAAAIVPAVYEAARLGQPGAITRAGHWWEQFLRDPAAWRDGASARFYVAYEAAPGEYAGYACYRIKSDWRHGLPNHTLRLIELVSVTPAAHAALWHYCLSVDLVGTVTTGGCAVDDPLRWLLADPRQLQVAWLGDSLWVRLLDIPAALAARRYSARGGLVLEVCDAFCPELDGRYRLDAGPDGAACQRTESAPDISLAVDALGATYLGGVSFSTLARAGRVVEQLTGALGRADALFGWERAPWCATMF